MKDRGCLLYGLFLLWLGIVIGIPSVIFDTRQVGIIGAIAASVGISAMALTGEAKENTFRKEAPFTYVHFWMFLAYAVGGMFTIGFGEMDYLAIKTLGKSIVFYAVLPIVVFIIETIITDKRSKANKNQE